MLKKLIIGVVALLLVGPASAGMYKCVDDGGGVTYSSVKCPGDEDIDEIEYQTEDGYGQDEYEEIEERYNPAYDPYSVENQARELFREDVVERQRELAEERQEERNIQDTHRSEAQNATIL